MKNKIRILIIMVLCLYFVPVSASNSIDYTLTITDDFEFKEVINYRIEDYQQRKNGYNYMADIIDEDIDADILGKTKYAKQKRVEANIYYVTLTKTFNEYTMSNSAFLNNCFEDSNYQYDINKYSFSGTGGFNCFDARNMKLTIITDFEVTSTNAQVDGNKYIWTPTNANFSMNIDMNKVYKETTVDPNNPYDDIGTDSTDDTQVEQQGNITESKRNTKATYIVFASIVGGALFIGLLAFLILQKRNKDLNKL